MGSQIQSGSYMVASSRASSSREDIMFVIYSRRSTHIVKAFKSSGELIRDYCFNIDLSTTPLPFHCGFAVVGPTLYMIGGFTFDKRSNLVVPNLKTYKIDLRQIPEFPNHSIPRKLRGFVKVGPRLHAKKEFPVVIMVGSKIYVFSRYLWAIEKSPTNFECLKTEAQGWELLSEPEFRMGLGEEGVLSYYEIESHVVEKEDYIVVRITGEGKTGVFKLNLHNHRWSSVNTKALLPFKGKGVCFNDVYYALMNRCVNNLQDRVVYFRNPFSPEVEEVADIQPFPKEVYWLHRCEFAVMGASFFIARTGYTSPPDPDAKDPAHHLSLENFEVSMVAGKAKAIKSHTMTFDLKVSDTIYAPKTLYFVSWVQSG